LKRYSNGRQRDITERNKLQVRDRWEIIANYKMQRVPQNQIAEIMGLSQPTISQICTSPEFEQFYTEHLKNATKQENEYDDGWDALEKVAIGNLLETASYIKDPKFMLQIAMVANKAQRRQSRFNHPLDASRTGAQPVVIQLRTKFVQNLQVNNVTPQDAGRMKLLDGNRTMNVPSPHRIEQAFAVPLVQSAEQEAEELLAEVKFGT
jgi:predicted XRE-type DNA-binding protein